MTQSERNQFIGPTACEATIEFWRLRSEMCRERGIDPSEGLLPTSPPIKPKTESQIKGQP